MNYIFSKQIYHLVCFVSLLIFVISLFWLGTKPEWLKLVPVNPPADKLLHLLVFGFMTALLWFSASHPQSLVIILAAALIGAMDEFHQCYIPGRTASFADFTADLIGIILTISVLKYTQRRFSPQIS